MILTDKSIDTEAYLAFIGQQESQEVHPVEDYWHKLQDLCVNGEVRTGAMLPWIKTHNVIRFAPGELSVWAGFSGSGKSLLLGQAVLWWLKDQTALIASLEMKPEQTLYRMTRQMVGHTEIKPPHVDGFVEKLSGRLWIYDQVDSVASNRILGLIHYAANELKCDHIIIDSLTKCGLTRDDYSQQAKFVDRIQWAAKRHSVHVHLVCHMRKGSDENRKPGKFDIRGAAEISDLADNVLVLHRNKEKEAASLKRSNGRALTRDEEDELKKPDATLRVDKNRAGGTEGIVPLWYHYGAMQFLGVDDPRAMQW